MLRLALEGISVYSPHTAVDAAPEGLGNWLADIVTGDFADSGSSAQSTTNGETGNRSSQSEESESPALSKSSSEIEHFTDAESSSERLRPPLPPRPYLNRQYSSPSYPILAQEDTDTTMYVCL